MLVSVFAPFCALVGSVAVNTWLTTDQKTTLGGIRDTSVAISLRNCLLATAKFVQTTRLARNLRLVNHTYQVTDYVQCNYGTSTSYTCRTGYYCVIISKLHTFPWLSLSSPLIVISTATVHVHVSLYASPHKHTLMHHLDGNDICCPTIDMTCLSGGTCCGNGCCGAS